MATLTQDDADDAEILLFSLVYCSRANEGVSSADVKKIVAAAQVKNAREEITGLLVYGSGIFFQWLEGRQASVERLMAAISADQRHNTIVVLNEAEEVRERLFSGWDMELVSPADIREVLVDALQATNEARSAEALQVLMRELDSKAIGTGP